MPKILENVRERILEETKRQLVEYGYGKTTVRSVAKSCEISIGTLYNNFETKDMIVAHIMLESWQAALARMREFCKSADGEAAVKYIFEEISDYSLKHKHIFDDKVAAKAFHAFSDKHNLLVDQLSVFIEPYCREAGYSDPSFAACFITEALLSHGVKRIDYAEISPIIKRLLRK